MQVNRRGQVLAIRQVAKDEDLAFYETLSIPCMKPGIHRNPESQCPNEMQRART